ncbi:MAG: transporter substrate-binding domain-containing protein [Motiliproteus sp.]
MRKGLLVLFSLISFSGICGAQTYNLASGEFPPFTSESLDNGGLATKIITTVINKMGHQTKVNFLPWKRGYQMTLRGRLHGTFAYSKNSQRLKQWFFSEPLYNLEEVFIARSHNQVYFRDNADLDNLIICKPIGYNLFGLKELQQQGVITLLRPADMNGCFRLLAKRRVDLVMTNSTTALNLIKQHTENPDEFHVLPKPFTTIGHHLIAPKSEAHSAAFINAFDAALLTLKKDGVIDMLIAKHLSENDVALN